MEDGIEKDIHLRSEMSLIEPNRLIKNIREWISSYVKTYGITSLILNQSSQLDEILSNLLEDFPIEYSTDYFNDTKIIVSSLSKNHYNLIRNYSKHTEFFDILPFADLFTSEILELKKYLSEKKYKENLPIVKFRKELRITEDELEWLNREDSRSSIVSSNEDPVKSYRWFAYTLRQQQIIAMAHQMEKKTRHKYNPNIPIFTIRNIEGFVI